MIDNFTFHNGLPIPYGYSLASLPENDGKCYQFAVANLFLKPNVFDFSVGNGIEGVLHSTYVENKLLEIYGINFYIEPMIRDTTQSEALLNKNTILSLFKSIESDTKVNVSNVCPLLIGVITHSKDGKVDNNLHRVLLLIHENFKGITYYVIDSNNTNVVFTKGALNLANYLDNKYSRVIDISCFMDKPTQEVYVDSVDKFYHLIDEKTSKSIV